jgi:hypothetical protein
MFKHVLYSWTKIVLQQIIQRYIVFIVEKERLVYDRNDILDMYECMCTMYFVGSFYFE